MTPEQVESARQLARLPELAPERCLFSPHAWSEWGLYRHVQNEVRYQLDEPPTVMPIRAWRPRICWRCGCEQVQNYDQSEVRTIADPYGIERERARRA